MSKQPIALTINSDLSLAGEIKQLSKFLNESSTHIHLFCARNLLERLSLEENAKVHLHPISTHPKHLSLNSKLLSRALEKYDIKSHINESKELILNTDRIETHYSKNLEYTLFLANDLIKENFGTARHILKDIPCIGYFNHLEPRILNCKEIESKILFILPETHQNRLNSQFLQAVTNNHSETFTARNTRYAICKEGKYELNESTRTQSSLRNMIFERLSSIIILGKCHGISNLIRAFSYTPTIHAIALESEDDAFFKNNPTTIDTLISTSPLQDAHAPIKNHLHCKKAIDAASFTNKVCIESQVSKKNIPLPVYGCFDNKEETKPTLDKHFDGIICIRKSDSTSNAKSFKEFINDFSLQVDRVLLREHLYYKYNSMLNHCNSVENLRTLLATTIGDGVRYDIR